MKKKSIMRGCQYKELSKITLNGSVLDLGGSRKSGYHELIQGNHMITVVNISEEYGYDVKCNVEETFPFQNEYFDNVLSLNLIEHVFDTYNIFSESARVLKRGGLFVSAIPYMHHIHGSPQDYVRYTESAYRKFADRYGFEIVSIKPLGCGIFSLIFQTATIYNTLPWAPLYNGIQSLCVFLDTLLCHVSYYKKVAGTIPLGYFWVMKKK